MASSKLAERLAKRQGIAIDKGNPKLEHHDAPAPRTHREKLGRGWKRVATVLPPDEHQAFRIAALRTDQEMSDIIRVLVAEWVNAQT